MINEENKKKQILVTGAAGFIGFHLARKLLSLGYKVVGIDNINKYYDINLKYNRLNELGIDKSVAGKFHQTIKSSIYPDFEFIRVNLEDREYLPEIFRKYNFEKVCNLAAQAGVRYSLKNPETYIDSNVVGFLNLLECCRNFEVKHLIYASSSSVYGQNDKVPFSVEDNVDHPISLYAATKKSNELMAHTYSYLYNFETTGLRFFTVYGPWGRPDMAMFLFTESIIRGKPIKVFNNGNLKRDFTYVDDIVDGVVKILEAVKKNDSPKYALYNIGKSEPVMLMDFIKEIEKQVGIKAKKDMYPMQPGDVSRTWADVDSLKKDFGYNPKTPISKGVENFVAWYKSYYS